VEVEGGTLTSIAGFDGHQGIAVVVAPRRFATLDDILARAVERGEPAFILVLDSLEDPQNLGTLLRSAEAAGVHGVVFPTRRQAPLSPAAVKASAGAVEHLLLCPVDDLPTALTDLHAHGLRVAGAEADAPLTAREADLRGPLAIVVGSEGQGLGPAVRRRCDVLMRIPMRGRVDSLNAAVAGSILLFEALAQRGGATPAPRTRAESPAESPGESPAEKPPKPPERRSTKAARAAGTPAGGSGEPGETAPKPRRSRAKPAEAATAQPAAAERATEAATAEAATAEPATEHEQLLRGGPSPTPAAPDPSPLEWEITKPPEA
jgi:23S rRNA (guanosine2251-2'-O)-methyltransferase